MLLYGSARFTSAGQQAQYHDAAAERAAQPAGTGNPAAEAGGDFWKQVRLYPLSFGNCQKDAFRSIEPTGAEEFSRSLRGIICHRTPLFCRWMATIGLYWVCDPFVGRMWWFLHSLYQHRQHVCQSEQA